MWGAFCCLRSFSSFFLSFLNRKQRYASNMVIRLLDGSAGSTSCPPLILAMLILLISFNESTMMWSHSMINNDVKFTDLCTLLLCCPCLITYFRQSKSKTAEGYKTWRLSCPACLVLGRVSQGGHPVPCHAKSPLLNNH